MASWISAVSVLAATPLVASVAWSASKALRARAEKVIVKIILQDQEHVIEIRSDAVDADHLMAALSALDEKKTANGHGSRSSDPGSGSAQN
jgi:hypothetical protein